MWLTHSYIQGEWGEGENAWQYELNMCGADCTEGICVQTGSPEHGGAADGLWC